MFVGAGLECHVHLGPAFKPMRPQYHMSSILFGDTMVPNIEEDYVSFWGIVFYIRNIILLGSQKKQYSHAGPYRLHDFPYRQDK